MPQIIIADDEPELRALLIEGLSSSNLQALEAKDGTEALQLLKQHPAVELLLSDVRMPGMDGYTLAEQGLRLNPELKIVMMTAFPTEHLPPAVLRAREVRTLTKPFRLNVMCDLVTEMLSRP